jgi:protein ImuA
MTKSFGFGLLKILVNFTPGVNTNENATFCKSFIDGCKKEEIISQLRKDILPLQGFRNLSLNTDSNIGFRPIELSFPNATFPSGCIHEFLSNSTEDVAATNGFITCLLSRLMQCGGICICISTSRTLFPPALKTFGIEPNQ